MPTLPQEGAPHKLAEVDWAAALEADMLVVVRQAIEQSSPPCSARAMHGTRRGWGTATGPRCGGDEPGGRRDGDCAAGAPADADGRAGRMGKPGAPGLRPPDAPGQCRAPEAAA